MPGFKLGRLPRDTSRWAPTLEDYLRTAPRGGTAGLLPVSDSEDVNLATKVTDIPMYMNGPDPGNPPASPDGIGDCTIAGMAHAFTAMAVYAGKPQPLFSDAAILAAYCAVSGYDPATGADDNGAQMQDVLAYMRTAGMPDTTGKVHKVIAYAALGNPADLLLLSECLATWGSVYTGINCPQSAEDQFGNGPWLYEPDSPIIGGHAISLHRRRPYGSVTGVWDFSTWGALQPVTDPFIGHLAEEAWIFCTQDWIEASGETCDGVALSQLISDMRFV
jgi:hypothetical protein